MRRRDNKAEFAEAMGTDSLDFSLVGAELIDLGKKGKEDPDTDLLVEAGALWLIGHQDASAHAQGFRVLAWMVQHTRYLNAAYHAAMLKIQKPWFLRHIQETAADLLQRIAEAPPTSQNQVLRGLAFASLSEMYRRGSNGATRDPERARHYAMEAARMGDPKGCYAAATYLAKGSPQHLELARQYLETSYNAADGKAAALLRIVLTKLEMHRRLNLSVPPAMEQNLQRLLVGTATQTQRRSDRRPDARDRIHHALELTPEKVTAHRLAIEALQPSAEDGGQRTLAQNRLRFTQEANDYIHTKLAKSLLPICSKDLPEASFTYLLELLGTDEGRAALLQWQAREQRSDTDDGTAEIDQIAINDDNV